MYFDTKSYLKNNHYHTAKHTLNVGLPTQLHKYEAVKINIMFSHSLSP